jgi:hypothetical protein
MKRAGNTLAKISNLNGYSARAHTSWLYRISGVAATIAAVLLLFGLIGLIAEVLLPIWLSPLHGNWLILILQLHAGFIGVQINLLHILNFLDIAILSLVAITFLGLFVALRKTSKIWSIVALVQPFLGIAIFIATENAGRSTVMGAGLVISAVMLWSPKFKKTTAYMGILANVLLLAGDFSAGVIPPSSSIATIVGFGYVLLITWYFVIARNLFDLSKSHVGTELISTHQSISKSSSAKAKTMVTVVYDSKYGNTKKGSRGDRTGT